MSYVITEPCIAFNKCATLDRRACVEVCPVDAIYEGAKQLFIHPGECIDCGACEPVCPVKAIFVDDEAPAQWNSKAVTFFREHPSIRPADANTSRALRSSRPTRVVPDAPEPDSSSVAWEFSTLTSVFLVLGVLGLAWSRRVQRLAIQAADTPRGSLLHTVAANAWHVWTARLAALAFVCVGLLGATAVFVSRFADPEIAGWILVVISALLIGAGAVYLWPRRMQRPPAQARRRLIHRIAPALLRRVLGGVVLLTGFGLFYVTAGLAVGFLIPTMVRRSLGNVLVFVSLLVATFFLSGIGWIVLAGRKRLVLFLRKFGMPDVAGVMQHALNVGLGKRYRLLTLEDHTFKAMPPHLRSRLLPPIFALVGTGFILAALVPTFSGMYERRFDVQALPIEISLLLGLVGSAPLLLVLLAIAAWMFLSGRRYRHVVIREIDSETALRRQAKILSRLNTWRFAPSFRGPIASVLRVTNALWKRSVETYAGLVDVIVIDLSLSSPSIGWEVELAMTRFSKTCVFIAERKHFESWASRSVPELDCEESRTLLRLVGDRTVLLYDGPDRIDSRVLFDAFDWAADQKTYTSVDRHLQPIIGVAVIIAISLMLAALLW